MDDLKRIGEIPCARNSLLAGIASGFGIGVIRGINTSASLVLVACFSVLQNSALALLFGGLICLIMPWTEEPATHRCVWTICARFLT